MENYRFGIDKEGEYTCIFSSVYGQNGTYETEEIPSHGREISLCVPVKGMSVSFYEMTKAKKKVRRSVTKKRERKVK